MDKNKNGQYGEGNDEKQERSRQAASNETIAEEQLDNVVGGQSNKKPYLDDINNQTVGEPPKDAQGEST